MLLVAHWLFRLVHSYDKIKEMQAENWKPYDNTISDIAEQTASNRNEMNSDGKQNQ